VSARYPVLLDLTDRDVLVVGGGPVAARRATATVDAGARVTVIAPAVCEDLADLVAAGSVRWVPRGATGGDVLAGPGPGARWWLVHTATGDRDVDAAVADAAGRCGTWCARADLAQASSAHVPAVAAGPDGVQVAVSGGGDPGRAAAVRDAIGDLLATGRLPLRRTRPRLGSGTGRVVLVGGGPGDPGLLTVAGRQWLARADVVVTDRLGPVDVLAELDPGVEVVDVGKTAGHHPIPQDVINRILVEHAAAGRTVVRLKGGDPFVLGRGGEEALHCVAHGIPVEVVPGVTSAVSVPAAAGIPVTHRGITTSFVLASAHAGAGDALEAARSAPRGATLVLLMGLSSLARTAAELVAAGHPPATPVAVVSSGWTAAQRTVVGTLATIAEDVATAGLASPAVTVVGEVVGLREVLGDLAPVLPPRDPARHPPRGRVVGDHCPQ
jgi:uroporphyrin-III C-methyltransferase/precorrin-2 dehydrogenase/sirohydrochlorin ferrochelatase